jgi:hypothetical protein
MTRRTAEFVSGERAIPTFNMKPEGFLSSDGMCAVFLRETQRATGWRCCEVIDEAVSLSFREKASV